MMKRTLPSRDELYAILETVKDPEVPVLSVVELGIIRDAAASDAGVVVTITPTYSGCPAMREIEADIRAAMSNAGIDAVEIRTTYSPPWTTDWMGDEAHRKLAAYGIAPPARVGATDASELVTLTRRVAAVSCPYCRSVDTEQKSAFGATACKSIWFCRGCQQPFEEFKAF